VDGVSGRKSLFEFHVYMEGKRVKRGFTSDEAVNVDYQKSAFLALAVLGV
jgi:hypothetical protein